MTTPTDVGTAYRAAVHAEHRDHLAALPARLADAARRELAAGRPAALADHRDDLTVRAIGTPAVPAPMPRTVTDARAVILDRLDELAVEVAELAAALGPETREGHHAARAFHALTDLHRTAR